MQKIYILFVKTCQFHYNGAMKKQNQENQSQNKIAKNTEKKKDGIALRIFKIILLIILLPFIAIYYLVRFIVKTIKKNKWEKEGKRGVVLLLSSTIDDIDVMEGYEFENYLKTLFFYAGFGAETTQKAKDYGADIILTDETGSKIVVQAKRYNKKVGVKSVQEVMGAMSHYKANEGMVVTNSTFSYEAETLAKDNSIRLVDRRELIEMYKRVQQNLAIKAKESTLVGDAKTTDETFNTNFPFQI